MNEPPTDVEAELTLLPLSDVEGTARPRYSGYRPQFYYGPEASQLSGPAWQAIFAFPETGCILPGETARVLIQLQLLETHIGYAQAGVQFTLREGLCIVARGRFLRVVNPALAP